MAFEEFKQKLGPMGKLRISIRKGGIIGISKGMAKEYAINTYTYAKLFYDDETDEIAIQFTTKKSYGAARIHFYGGNNGIFLQSVSFLRFCGLDPHEDSGQFEYRYDEERELFIFGPVAMIKTKKEVK